MVESPDATPLDPQADPEGPAGAPRESFLTRLRTRGWRYVLVELLKTVGLGAVVRVLFASGSAKAAPPKSIDDVAREVLAEMEAAEPAVPSAGPPASPQPEQEQAPPVDVQQFLSKLEQRERDEREAVEERIAKTRAREATLYAVLLATAVLTAAFAFVAVALVVTGHAPVGLASGALALLPGAGTVLMRRMWQKERSDRDALDERRNEHARLLDAIEFTLSLPDGAERNRQAAELAVRLQDRALGHATS